MSDRRFVTSAVGCPSCGCDSAIVRVRGNAFAATCVDCGQSEIAPMLGARELLDAFGEGELVEPVAIVRARSWFDDGLRMLTSRAVLDDSIDLRGELDRQLDAVMSTTLRMP